MILLTMFCMDIIKLNIKIRKTLMSEYLSLNRLYQMKKMKNQKLRMKNCKNKKNKIKSNLYKLPKIKNSFRQILLKNSWIISLLREIKLSLHKKQILQRLLKRMIQGHFKKMDNLKKHPYKYLIKILRKQIKKMKQHRKKFQKKNKAQNNNKYKMRKFKIKKQSKKLKKKKIKKQIKNKL